MSRIVASHRQCTEWWREGNIRPLTWTHHVAESATRDISFGRMGGKHLQKACNVRDPLNIQLDIVHSFLALIYGRRPYMTVIE